ncbi:MAG: hypothetical protein R2734_07435 [Nocardioides sp.]
MTTGVITTFAGNGSAGYNGDEIAAPTARLNSPYGVDVDNDGNVYIADYDNERVRVVDTNGVIHTFAGTGVATIDGDGGPATEAGLHAAVMSCCDAERRRLDRRVEQPGPARDERPDLHHRRQWPSLIRGRRRPGAVSIGAGRPR